MAKYTMEELQELTRREIQNLCKEHSIKANGKTQWMIEQLCKTQRILLQLGPGRQVRVPPIVYRVDYRPWLVLVDEHAALIDMIVYLGVRQARWLAFALGLASFATFASFTLCI